MTRRIILALASDTTETECGACRRNDNGTCGAFGVPLPRYEGKWRRVSECIVAEYKPISQMVSEEVERKGASHV